MNNEISRSKIISGLLWKTLERGGVQGMQFIVHIILARLLLPSDYGMIMIVSIFIIIATIIMQNGFNTALVQKKNVDEIDYSSVFYLSLIVAVMLYIVLYFTAPLIADFYEQTKLIYILRVLSLTLFIGVFNSIQNAIIMRDLAFKKLFFSSIGAVIMSGVVGIVLAYKGYGVWSLVAQQIISLFLGTLTLWIIIPWRPKLKFSFARIKCLFAFGWKLLVSSFIDNIFINLRSLIIGKIYNADILGYYNRGKQFPELLVYNINGSIQSVLFPVMSQQQVDIKRVKQMVQRSIKLSCFVVTPVMVGLAAIARPLVIVLLTEKWIPAVPFLQIFCLTYACRPIHTTNLQAINALGRSDIFLKLEIIKKIIGIAILILSIPYGVYFMAIGTLLGSIFSIFFNAYPNKKLLDYSLGEMLKDITPAFLLSVIMGFIVYSIQWIKMTIMVTLISQILLGVVLYVGFAKLFGLESYCYLKSILLNTIKSIRGKV